MNELYELIEKKIKESGYPRQISAVATVYRTLLPIGIALGVGIGFVGSFFTIRKHLKV